MVYKILIMFGLFKKNKKDNWGIDLLKIVLKHFINEYPMLIEQVNRGILKGILSKGSDIPNYIAFTYNYEVFKKYDNTDDEDYKLTNIVLIDKDSKKKFLYEVYISSGTISGYSLTNSKEINLNNLEVDSSNYHKEIIGTSDYDRIVNILTINEKKILNPFDIYSVNLEGKEYFHLKELEDGDFIGIDKNKNVYKITQDPYEIVLLEKSIEEIIK